MQQHEEKRKAKPGPEVLLPGGGPARALHQRPRLSDRLVRVRTDNCQGNPSNYARLIIILYVAYDPSLREMAFRNVPIRRPVALFFLFFFYHQRLRIRASSRATRNCAGNGAPHQSRLCTPARWASTRTGRTRRWSCMETSSLQGT